MAARKAFTITELLVLMGIILILSAILIPAILRSREISNRQSCINNLRALGISLHLYAQNSNGWLPSASPLANTCSDAEMPLHAHNKGDEWLRPFSLGVYWLFIPDFLKDGTRMFCPSQRTLRAADSNKPFTFALSSTYVFPAYDKKGRQNKPLPGYALEDLVGSYSIMTNNPTYNQQADKMVAKIDDQPTFVIAGELSGGIQSLWFTKTHYGWLGNSSCNHYVSKQGRNWQLDIQNELLLNGEVESKTPTDLKYEAFFNPKSDSKYRHYY